MGHRVLSRRCHDAPEDCSVRSRVYQLVLERERIVRPHPIAPIGCNVALSMIGANGRTILGFS